MKYLLTFLCLFTSSLQAKAIYPDITVSEVISVYDGDTFKVNIDNYPAVIGESISIRIRGIDAPEIRGKCVSEKAKAIEARDFLKQRLASGKLIELHNVQRGKYFRLVAKVVVDDVDVSQALIDKGLARLYDGRAKRETWCS